MGKNEIFADCFKDVPNLEDLRNCTKRKRKIKK